MASGEVRTEPHVDRGITARTGTVSGGLGPEHADHRSGPAAGKDREVTDFTTEAGRRVPGPFTPRQLSRLDEALTLSSRETGLGFSVWVGALEEPTREHAERLHAGLPHPADGVLLAVSPGQRVLHIVTGEHSSRRVPDRAAALAALSMRASLSVGDLVGALVNGLRMLSDQAGRTSERAAGTPLAPPHHRG